MSVLAELDTSLQALLALKAPGVTKSRIASITTLCVENVKSESTLVQKIYTHFRRAPATHKLGVLYVVDAVTRQWIDKAGSSGQEISTSSPQDGTFAAGVQKITQLLPQMMADLISNSPYDQKDKIGKLVDIWERGNIFPAEMTTDFKSKLDARKPNPEEQQQQKQEQQVPDPQPAALPQPNAPATTQQYQAPPSAQSAPINLPSFAQGNGPAPNGATATFPPQASAPPMAQSGQQQQPSLNGVTPEQLQQLAAVIPQHILADPVALQQRIQILQQLAQMNVPPEQWGLVMDAMAGQEAGNNSQATAAPPPQQLSMQPQQQAQPAYPSPARNRSRSPVRQRDSPSYGEYRGNDAYRQRSPDRSNTPSMQSDMIPLGGPKWTTFDASIPEGNIRVLSRTLFVGGTTCGEPELRHIFEPFGQVQTCIPNPDKRHAFVKYTNRAGAEAAREAMSNVQDPNLQAMVRSVRWGVGFGPRDCNDYTTGISIIPIDRLTDADRKWVLTAPHGGSGGKPIESGLVMEEPDIEIGAGVSSKAISRRVGGGQETFKRGGGRDGFQRRGGGGDRGYGSQRRSSPNRQQPNMVPPQRWDQPMAMPQYGMPPQGNFYGMNPGQGAMHHYG